MHTTQLSKITDIKSLLDKDPLIVGDFSTGEWYDEELDISDIPAILLFAAINNSYSTGFGLYIGLDMCFSKFVEHVSSDLANGKTPKFCGSGLVDFDHLNKTGKIASTKQWNKTAAQNGSVWIFKSGALNTIQGIVNSCRKFLEK